MDDEVARTLGPWSRQGWPPMPADTLARLAAVQGGVVATAQLERLGTSADAARKRAGAGTLHRHHRGTYAVGHPLLTARGRQVAALLAHGPDVVRAGRTAGAAHELTRPGPRVELLRVRGRPFRDRAVHVRSTRRLHVDDVVLLDGLPTLSVARALLELADQLQPAALRRAAEQAVRLGTFDLLALEALLARTHGRAAGPRLRNALARVADVAPRFNSTFEEELRTWCEARDLRVPAFNVWLEDQEVDAHWFGTRLVLELDGPVHGDPVVAAEDDERRERLERRGYVVRRVLPGQLRPPLERFIRRHLAHP